MIILCSGSRYSNGGGSGSGSGSGYQKRNPGEELFCRDNFLSISALQMIDQVDWWWYDGIDCVCERERERERIRERGTEREAETVRDGDGDGGVRDGVGVW